MIAQRRKYMGNMIDREKNNEAQIHHYDDCYLPVQKNLL